VGDQRCISAINKVIQNALRGSSELRRMAAQLAIPDSASDGDRASTLVTA
jgi:hypothetical protein